MHQANGSGNNYHSLNLTGEMLSMLPTECAVLSGFHKLLGETRARVLVESVRLFVSSLLIVVATGTRTKSEIRQRTFEACSIGLG